MIDALRTPEECFLDIPAFPYVPHYVENLPGFEPLRMHYVDTGETESGEVFLCLHGQPTWSFLYRKMLPVFSAAGHRAVAPDLFGFGRSDKPVKEEVYTFDFHRRSLIAFVEALDLRNITLVCQDWGGLLGLTLPMAMPERFSRLIVMNTALATGEDPLSEGFLAWRAWARKNPDMDIAALMARTTPHLSEAESRAYAAPYPDIRYKAGVRRFPDMVPDRPDAPGASIARQARDWFASEWHGESFMAIGHQDPVLGPPAMNLLRRHIPNCPDPLNLHHAGHFVQEWGDEVAVAALKHFGLS